MTFDILPSRPRGLRRGAVALAVVLGLSGLAFSASPAFAADAFFPPTAKGDAYQMVQGTTLDVAAAQGVLANDTYSDAGPLNVNAAWFAGTLSVHPLGDFSFTPDPSFTGTYTFQYTAIDKASQMESGKATVTITVTPKPNQAPVANPDTYQMVQGGVLHIDEPGVLANDTDADGDALVASAIQGHNSAEVVLNTAGWLTYTPAPSFTGVTTFQYQASDGHQSSNWTTVTITVSPKALPEPPVANPDTYTTPKNTPLVIAGPGVLANDVIPTGTGVVGDWVDNSLEVIMTPDGGFIYTPAKDFVGTKTFKYHAFAQIGDSGLASNWATVTITVTDTKDPTDIDATPAPTPAPTPPAHPGPALAQTGGAVNAGLLLGGGAVTALGGAVLAFAAWRRRISG